LVEWNRLADKAIFGDDIVPEANSRLMPDFCRGELVLRVIVIAQLLALVVSVLVEGRYSTSPLQTLVMASLFVQWIALTSVVLLCCLRAWLNRLPPVRAFVMAYLLLVCVTFVISELFFWVVYWVGVLPSPRPDWYPRFHIQNLVVSIVANALLLRYLLGREELRRVTRSEEQARTEVLKYRIRPHFLFNAMNTTASLLRRKPARAEAAIMDLAELFRLMLDENKSLVSLQKEIDLAKKYLSLESLRLDDRLKVTWDVDDIPRSARTPVQILQLLLEHAIHVGIDPLADGGEISIRIRADERQVLISIDCPLTQAIARTEGIDLPKERNESMRDDGAGRESGNASGGLSGLRSDAVLDTTALDNIRLRLKDLYHGSGALDSEIADERYVVTVRHEASGGAE